MSSPLERPDIRVVARILEALWKNNGPMRPTQLQQASGTNYSQFERYLDLLRERGLVDVSDLEQGALIRLTVRGEQAHSFLVRAVSLLLSGRPRGIDDLST